MVKRDITYKGKPYRIVSWDDWLPVIEFPSKYGWNIVKNLQIRLGIKRKWESKARRRYSRK